MAQTSGFFNALKDGMNYDRKYNATDYTDNLGAIISNGVRRSADNELRVSASGGMGLNVNIGRAWINGFWYKNDSVFDDFIVPTAPVGDNMRIDRVVLQLNTNTDGRIIELKYLIGAASVSPTAPTLTRSGGIYEIALADITIAPGVTGITQVNITDQRANKEVCGWITTPIGYDDFFDNLDAEFSEWFTGVKDRMASVTLFKQYHQRITIESATSTAEFNIPQYDPSGVDILNIYINGLLQIETEDYNVNDSVITFLWEVIAGTVIDVIVYKSIDGTGLGSVSDEVAALQEQMSLVKDMGEYIYICNGVDDNIKLSEIAQAFLTSDTMHDQLTINVYGEFGATAPYAGSGTTTSRYRWFSLGGDETSKKKIVFDFLNCSEIHLSCKDNFHYIGFYGANINIKNANITIHCQYSGCTFVMFSSTIGAIYAENCRFWIASYNEAYIAQTGRFDNCFAHVCCSAGNSYCFKLANNGLIRINGGEYYAYSGLNSANSAVIYSDTASKDGIVITNNINCPKVPMPSFYQKNAVLCSAGLGSFSDTITTLTVSNSNGQNVRNNISANKPGYM